MEGGAERDREALEKELQDARAALELTEEIHQMEIEEEREKYNDLLAELEEEREKYRRADSDLHAVKDELRRFDAQLQAARSSSAPAPSTLQREEELLKEMRRLKEWGDELEQKVAEAEKLREEDSRTAQQRIDAAVKEAEAKMQEKLKKAEFTMEGYEAMEARLKEEKENHRLKAEQLIEMEARVAQADAIIKEHEQSVSHEASELQQSLQEALQGRKEAEERAERAQEKARATAEELAQNQEALAKCRKELTDTETEVARLELRLKEEVAAKDDFASRLGEAEGAKRDIEEALQKNTDMFSSDVQQWKDQAAQVQDMLAKERNEAATLREQIELLQQRVADREQTLVAKEKTVDGLKGELANAKERFESRDKSATDENNTLRQRIAELTEAMHRETLSLRQNLSDAEARARDEGREATAKLREKEEEIERVVQQLNEATRRAEQAEKAKAAAEQQLQETMDKVRGSLETAEKEITGKLGEVEELKHRLKEEQQAREAAAREAENTQDGLQGHITMLERKVADAQNDAAAREQRLQAEVDRLKATITELHEEQAKELADAARQLREREDEWHNTLREADGRVREKTVEAEETIRGLRAKLDEASFNEASLRDKLFGSEERTAALETEVKILRGDLEASRALLRDTETQMRAEARAAEERERDLGVMVKVAEDKLREAMKEHEIQLAEWERKVEKAEEMLRSRTVEFSGLRNTHNQATEAHAAQLSAERLEWERERNKLKEEIRTLSEDYEARLKQLTGELDTAKQDAAREVERIKDELQTSQKEHQRRIEDMQREMSAAMDKAEGVGRAKAGKEWQEKLGRAEMLLRVAQEEVEQKSEAYMALNTKYNEALDEWKKALQSERAEANSRLAAQRAEFKAKLDEAGEQIRESTAKNMEARKEVLNLESQLAMAKQEMHRVQSSLQLQLSQAETRLADHESWHTRQVDEEVARREKAEAEVAKCKKVTEELQRTAGEIERRLSDKCLRLERENTAALREAAKARARFDSLQIQLDEREKALRNAGQRIAAASEAGSPSPRRSPSGDGGEMHREVGRQSSRAANAEAELAKEQEKALRYKHRVEQLQQELKELQRASEASEARAQRLADSHEHLERDLRQACSEVERLRYEADEAKQLLKQEQDGRAAERRRLEANVVQSQSDVEAALQRALSEVEQRKAHEQELMRELEEKEEGMAKVRRQAEEECRHALELRRAAQAEAQRTTALLKEAQGDAVQHSDRLSAVMAELAGSKAETDKLREVNAQLRKDCDAARDETSRAAEEREELVGKLADAHAELQRHRDNASNLMTRLQCEKEVEHAALTRKAEAMVGEVKSEQRLLHLSRIEASTTETSTLRAKLRTAESTISDLRSQVQCLQGRVEHANQLADEAKKRAAELEDQAQSAQRRLVGRQSVETRLRRELGEAQHLTRASAAEADTLRDSLREAYRSSAMAENKARVLTVDVAAESARTAQAWGRAAIGEFRAARAESKAAAAERRAASSLGQLAAHKESAALTSQLTSVSSDSPRYSPPRHTPRYLVSTPRS